MIQCVYIYNNNQNYYVIYKYKNMLIFTLITWISTIKKIIILHSNTSHLTIKKHFKHDLEHIILCIHANIVINAKTKIMQYWQASLAPADSHWLKKAWGKISQWKSIQRTQNSASISSRQTATQSLFAKRLVNSYTTIVLYYVVANCMVRLGCHSKKFLAMPLELSWSVVDWLIELRFYIPHDTK